MVSGEHCGAGNGSDGGGKRRGVSSHRFPQGCEMVLTGLFPGGLGAVV